MIRPDALVQTKVVGAVYIDLDETLVSLDVAYSSKHGDREPVLLPNGSMYYYRRGSEELLRRLRGDGFNVYMFTHGGIEEQGNVLIEIGFSQYFEDIYSSTDKKPSPEVRPFVLLDNLPPDDKRVELKLRQLLGHQPSEEEVGRHFIHAAGKGSLLDFLHHIKNKIKVMRDD